MKVLTIILKVLAVLAVIAGVVFVVATYGDRIVAWAKKLLNKTKRKHSCICEDDCDDCQCEADCNACPCVGACQEDVAEDADFEG